MAESPVLQIRVPDPELLDWLDVWAEYRGESRSRAALHVLEMVKRQHPDPMPPSMKLTVPPAEPSNGTASHAPTCTCAICKPPKAKK